MTNLEAAERALKSHIQTIPAIDFETHYEHVLSEIATKATAIYSRHLAAQPVETGGELPPLGIDQRRSFVRECEAKEQQVIPTATVNDKLKAAAMLLNVIGEQQAAASDTQPASPGRYHSQCLANRLCDLFARQRLELHSELGAKIEESPLGDMSLRAMLGDAIYEVVCKSQPASTADGVHLPPKSSQGDGSPAASQGKERLNLDHDESRALHRIVRAMHDGECPKCHQISDASEMWRDMLFIQQSEVPPSGWQCPACAFYVTEAEGESALKIFAPFMERNLEIFEKWRATR